MQAGISTLLAVQPSLETKIRWFSLGPIAALILFIVVGAGFLTNYQKEHDGRIFTGVYVDNANLSGLTVAEAAAILNQTLTYTQEPSVRLIDPQTGRVWEYTPDELGLTYDVDATVTAAFQIGRDENIISRYLDQFDSGYYGRKTSPIMIFDQSQLLTSIDAMALEIGKVPTDDIIRIEGSNINFIAGEVGRTLDKVDAETRLTTLLTDMQTADVELLIHESRPQIFDNSGTAADLQNIVSSPVSFYLQNPIDGVDLDEITLPVAKLREWLRVSVVENEVGNASYKVFVDEVALSGWLSQYASQVGREPENARFYFDDPTKELVLVEEHVSGRELDIVATVGQFTRQVTTPNRSIPLVINEIVPLVNSGAKAADLGIVELVSESITWFYGSPVERKHNIARAAESFYGIVIAPGEEFSFNKYLGEISEEDGYDVGLVIVGGQTIEGVGGGVCQVSTTLFQAVFWGGFPFAERWNHGYQVSYYNDGEGTGMDATVYSPIVDLKFVNNTENHLLIENYYNEEFESLTFKIYSTDIGRVVEKSPVQISNVIPPNPDVWEFDPDLEPGEIVQIDYAAEGADVTVDRAVYNFNGDVILNDSIDSQYIPWQNTYRYGLGIDPNNLPRNWKDLVKSN